MRVRSQQAARRDVLDHARRVVSAALSERDGGDADTADADAPDEAAAAAHAAGAGADSAGGDDAAMDAAPTPRRRRQRHAQGPAEHTLMLPEWCAHAWPKRLRCGSTRQPYALTACVCVLLYASSTLCQAAGGAA